MLQFFSDDRFCKRNAQIAASFKMMIVQSLKDTATQLNIKVVHVKYRTRRALSTDLDPLTFQNLITSSPVAKGMTDEVW